MYYYEEILVSELNKRDTVRLHELDWVITDIRRHALTEDDNTVWLIIDGWKEQGHGDPPKPALDSTILVRREGLPGLPFQDNWRDWLDLAVAGEDGMPHRVMACGVSLMLDNGEHVPQGLVINGHRQVWRVVHR